MVERKVAGMSVGKSPIGKMLAEGHGELPPLIIRLI
jgi:hypothetical protein